MATLIDTSVLGRLANRSDASYQIAAAAVAELHRRSELLHITPQNLVEFRNFATRPIKANGLGLAASTVEGLAANFEAAFALLGETPSIYPTWKTIVEGLGVVGKQVHDARIVAVCHVHGVTHLLTFNISHFARMVSFGPGLVLVDPAAV
jgi:predicted nucleic acid-binding protein